MQLRAEGITHRFAGRESLFDNMTITAEPGRLIGLVGPSGSGKSTMLSVLGGFLIPQAGRVHRDEIHSIGWVFQNPIGPPRRTAIDLVTYPFLLRGMTRSEGAERAMQLMARFGLAGREESLFRGLSGGESQRLLLARAVACDFDAILVDEPTAQLDPRSAATVIEVITEMVAPDRVTIVATHDARLIAQCDEVIDLGAG